MKTENTFELKVYVMAEGVKKRCRKTSREMLKLGNFPLDADKELIMEEAKALVMHKMKSCIRASVHFDRVEFFNYENGYHLEQWLMFDPRHEIRALTLT